MSLVTAEEKSIVRGEKKGELLMKMSWLFWRDEKSLLGAKIEVPKGEVDPLSRRNVDDPRSIDGPASRLLGNQAGDETTRLRSLYQRRRPTLVTRPLHHWKTRIRGITWLGSILGWIPWNLSFSDIHCTGQFTPKMKANAEPYLLSSLVGIDSGVVVSQHRLESFFTK